MKKYLLLGCLWVISTIFVHAQVPADITAAPSATVDAPFEISFTDNSAWRLAVSQISYGDDILPAKAYDLSVADKILFYPDSSEFLQNDTTLVITITSTNTPGVDGTVSQIIGHGIAANIIMVTQPTDPGSNGGLLGTQPVVKLQDKYNNECTGGVANQVTAAADASGDWTLGGTGTTVTSVGGTVTFAGLTGSSDLVVNGAYLVFSSGSLPTLNSDPFDIPVNTPPTLTAATGATVDASFILEYIDDATWETTFTSVTYDGVELLLGTDYTIDTGADEITLIPSGGNSILQVPHTDPGDLSLEIIVSGYANASVDQIIGHGIAANIIMVTQPTDPGSNGGLLGTQPVVKLQDKYSNDCIGDEATQVTVAADVSGAWTLGGTGTTVTSVGGTVTFAGLTGSSDLVVNGAYLVFSSGILPTLNSDPFNIPVNLPPGLIAASGATVDSPFEISYSPDDIFWEANIDSIQFDGVLIPQETYTVNSTQNKVIFDASALDSEIRTAKTGDIEIFVSQYDKALISQTIGHGAANNLVVATEPVAPANNGDSFQTQPVVNVRDQYNNLCAGNSTVSISAEENDPASWDLQGTLSGTVASGILTYSDLTASSTQIVNGAFISFSASGLTGVNSTTFNLALNTPPGLTAASVATVDAPFIVTFSDSQSWQSKISSITYNGNTVDGVAYDTSIGNRITFDPSQSTALQTSGTADFVIFSDGFNSTVPLTQIIGHGAANQLAITTEPGTPSINGGNLNPQPAIEIRDQYSNFCSTDGNRTITAAKADAGSWTLGGTPDQNANLGVLTFSGLTASSALEVTGASIEFTSPGITPITSSDFSLGLNDAPSDITAAGSVTVDNPFTITFTDENDWQSNINGITYSGTTVDNAAYNTATSGEITFTPSLSSALQTSGTADFVISADGFNNSSPISQVIGHGSAKAIVMVTEPSGPSVNGGQLQNQPVVKLQDQYDNDCTSDNSTSVTVAKGDTGNWTLGGDATVSVSSGTLSYTNLTASSNETISSAFLSFISTGLTSVNSSTFSIGLNDPPSDLAEDGNADVDSDFTVTFTDIDGWQSKISAVTYNGLTVDAVAYDITTPGEIVFTPSSSTALQTAGTANLIISANGFSNATLSQTISHGAVNKLAINTQPGAPSANGGDLNPQPVIEILDQYDNLCTSDGSRVISAAKGDAGNWILGGALNQNANSGTHTFADLTASSNENITGANISFSSTGLTGITSSDFSLGLNTAPNLTASSGTTVDGIFEISYDDNVDWESDIDSISFDGNIISPGAYSVNSTSNKITFNPSVDAVLQMAKTADIVVFVDGYDNATVSQTLGHGVATKLVMDTEPVPSGVNGNSFTTQPVVAIQDQYDNTCTTNSAISITAAGNDPVNWTLGGTLVNAVASGILTYTDLTASSDALVAGAFISFTASGLTGVGSTTFDLGLNSAPALTATSGVTVDGVFTVTFVDENSWQSKVSSIGYGGVEIDASAYNTLTSGQITFDPSLSTTLQTAGTEDFIFVAAGFSNATLSQTIGHGVPASIKVNVEPTAPTSNGSLLVQQPIVISQDQYLNPCTSDNATAISVVKGDAGSWSLGGSPDHTLGGGSFTYTDLSATSDAPVIGAYLTFSSGSFPTVNSATFDIPVNVSPSLSPAINATVDGEFQIVFADNAAWRGSISDITVDGNSIPAAAYDATIATRIIFKPVQSNFLQTAGTKEIIIISSGYENDTLNQELGHGIANELFIFTQPVGPSSNGGQLATQPVVHLRDQYANICTTDNTSTISETTSGGTWALGGITGLTASSGVFTYADLTANSSAELTTASITFSSVALTDVVSTAFTIPSLDASPTLLASSTATVDASFEITFGANATWQLAIDSISYDGNLIDATAYNITQSGKIIFDPSLDTDLQVAGTKDLIVYALGYNDASVSQQIKHGVATDMVIVLQPSAPVENGALLANQPVVTLRDQYANDCTSENTIEITGAKGDANVWTLGGTLVKKVTNGSASFTDLTASSGVAITDAFVAFSSVGLTTVNSNTFDIPDLAASPVLTAASGVTVDSNFDITFVDNPAWRSQVTEIRYGNEVLPVGAYDTSIEGIITFKPIESPVLQTVASKYIYITSTSFLKDSVLQAIGHGAATSIVITTEPQQPASNAGLLQTQPGVKIQDQYSNDCTTNSVQTINANATGGSWVVEGTTSLMVTNGIVDFTDLTARSTDLVIDATITFSGTGLTSQESATFIIPAPLIAPFLIASTTATVDSLFDVTFSENAGWQGEIDSISYGGNLFSSDVYDKSQGGKIVFDPSKSTELQVVGTKEILVYSRGYQNAAVNQEIKHGIPDTIFIDRQPTAPLVNGGSLDTQPRVSVRDQYNNSCGSNDTFEITATNGDAQAWTLGGSVTQSVISGVLTYSDLIASSETAITGAFITFSGAGLTSVNSDPFDIVELLNPPNINPAFQVTVDADFSLSFFAIDDTWRNSVTTITYEGDTLPASAYSIGTESIVFHISQEVLLQKAGTFNIVIYSTGYSNVLIEQEVGHGAIASMEITQQPLAPLTNGDVLEQQPILRFLDQYANECTSEIQESIIVSRNDTGDWSLAGTVEQIATNGIVTFTDLSAYSSGPVTDAELQFSSTDLTSVVSTSFTIPDVSSAPVLNAAIDVTVDNPFKITFTEDSVWRSRINVVTVNDSVLGAASYNTSQVGELELIPSESEFLQKNGSFQIIVQSRGFAHDTVQQNINHGLADSLLITSQPLDPENNGELLAQQPVLKLSDQYLNDCTGDNLTQVSVVKYDQNVWTLGGTLQAQSVSGVVSFTDLMATSEIAIDSAYLQFSFDKDTVISALFTIPVPIIELTAALDVTVDNEFTIQASDNASWRDSISAISFAGETLVDTSYLIEAGGITFYPDRDSILQIARTDTLIVIANGYANAIVEQSIKHGVATDMVIVDQPIGPENNGDTLAQQPKLQLKDQYENDCENDNATQILTSKYSDGSETDVVDLWNLGGVKTITAIDGLVTYLNLTAASENRVEGARLLFTSDALPNVVSDSFDIVIPPPPVILGAVDASVDGSFFVEFTDNKTWRSLIFDIRYGIRSLGGNYDISEPGKITFDPTVTSILQKSGVDSMYIYSGNYDTVRFEQTIHHGKSKYMVIVKEPSAPLKNGEVLLRQPQLKLQDQFRNNCVTDNETPIAVKKGDDGDWSLKGTFTQIAVDGLIKYIDLTAASEREVEGARLEFEGTGIIPKLSQSFTIPEPQENRAGEAKANPELVCYGASSSITLVGFDGTIQWQKFDELNEIYKDLAGENAEILISDEVVQNTRYRAMVSKEGFTTQYSNSVSVSPIEPPLADFTFEIEYNRVDFVNLSTNATTIVWDFGDGILSSEFEPSHSFVLDNTNGTGYVVRLTASNDACPKSEKSQQVFITTGIEDLILETGLVVYPNPSRGEFFIEISNSDQNGVLRIFDQAGKVVATRNIENSLLNNRIAFDLKNLTGGIYFLTIQYPNKVVRTKLIIQ
ncbi:hemoblobin-interacting domain-containing protein [Labilibaculum antarcticum]|uniref:Uncharacterized protein n=1 Tax=Labilibaculum antarcticum TaxID=1717717 RepID=A0A1Y1CNI6_9BACT|nr:hemoblobin-interacting domain-containing protein [Labilibaculum antarcticum]BAX81850.1 hypothetical protein ALGA_3552 [Labilibaculum antarcticum]